MLDVLRKAVFEQLEDNECQKRADIAQRWGIGEGTLIGAIHAWIPTEAQPRCYKDIRFQLEDEDIAGTEPTEDKADADVKTEAVLVASAAVHTDTDTEKSITEFYLHRRRLRQNLKETRCVRRCVRRIRAGTEGLVDHDLVGPGRPEK